MHKYQRHLVFDEIMILRDYLEAEEFLNESLFDSIIETGPLNEAFKSDIARKLAKSSIFRYFPEGSAYSIPSEYRNGVNTITKGEKIWRTAIGRTRKGLDLYSQLFKVKLDQLEDSDFTLISKADARRKKYADGYIFWMDDKDEVAAISTGNYVDLKSAKSKVFTGKILGADKDFDPEGKKPYDMVSGGKYKNDKGEDIKYERDYKRVISRDKETTLSLQKNPYIEYCYFLPFSVTKEKQSDRKPYTREPSNNEIRRDNIERYEKEKVKRRRETSKNCLPEYDAKFKTILVNPLKKQLDAFFADIDKAKGGINTYSTLAKMPNSINKMEEFFSKFYRLVNSLDRNYFYDYSKATESYEKDIREQKSELDEFLNNV